MPTPDAIVLNIDRPVQEFRKKLKVEHDYPEYVSEIVHSIICCCDEKDRAEYQVKEFAAEVEFAEHMRDDSAVMIDPDYAQSIYDLGMRILSHLNELNIFDENGELSYEYYSYEIAGFPGTILKRIER